MTPEEAKTIRGQMLRDGYCLIEDILTEEFLLELRKETKRLNATLPPNPDTRYQGTHLNVDAKDNPVIRKLAEWQPAREALESLGFGDFSSSHRSIILTKPALGPALYWHQDWGEWNDPISASPWPQTIFLNYYLQNTAIENGCLKVIPGSHLRRIPLHDQLVTAHEQGARFIKEDHPIMFSNHPEQVDVSVRAGSLVLGEGRLLHAAHRNQTSEPRDLVLFWHHRVKTLDPFRYVATPPDYWQGHIPQAILDRDANANYPKSRIPGKYLQP